MCGKQTQKVSINEPSLISAKSLLKSLVGEVVVYDIRNGEIRYNVRLLAEQLHK